jgi:hypothetical protein
MIAPNSPRLIEPYEPSGSKGENLAGLASDLKNWPLVVHGVRAMSIIPPWPVAPAWLPGAVDSIWDTRGINPN